MFAVYVERPNASNPLDALIVGERDAPVAPDGWARLRINAASLNWHDLWTLRGLGAANGRPEVFPMILGCDGVGRLDDGARAIVYPVVNAPGWMGNETLDPGREVFGEALQGTFADYFVAPRRNLVPLPDALSDEAAAVLGASWLTAYRMLFTLSGLRAGQTMLVQGGAGGVASALVQLGSAAGMRVWATARTPEKRAVVEALGAERCFDANAPLPERVDAVFEPVGPASWDHSMASVKTGGVIVVCGATSGMTAELNLPRLFIEQITIRGVFAGTLDEFKNLLSFVAKSGIKPHVGHVMPMADAAAGVQLMASGQFKGKIVLTR